MSENAGCAERFLYALFAKVVKPISHRRLLISGFCALLFAFCIPAQAQQTNKVPKIGILRASSPSPNTLLDAFRQGLRELGYVEGQNVSLEYRWARNSYDRLPDLAAELARLKVDVIFSASTPATDAARQATRTIPIVFVNVADPVASGLVASLARSGGNITGLANISSDLSGKQLELLRSLFRAPLAWLSCGILLIRVPHSS